MTLDEFITDLVNDFGEGTRERFGKLDRWALEKSMLACGMTELPTPKDDDSWVRTSGKVICEVCGQDYFHHPMDWRVIGYENRPFLNIICDGGRVKL